MAFISVQLDSALSHYTEEKNLVLDTRELEEPVTVDAVLRKLSIPHGMVGCATNGKRLLSKHDAVVAPCELKFFGIYSGG